MTGSSLRKLQQSIGRGVLGLTLIITHILYVGSDHVFGFKILNFYIYIFLFGGGDQKKMWGGGGYDEFVDIFRGNYKMGHVIRVISMGL